VLKVDPGLAHAAEFRRCLVDLDVVGICKLWQHVSPHLPQPASNDETLFALHVARTKTPNLPPKLLAYSKAWLAERERRRFAHAVGIAVGAPPWREKQAIAIREAMSDAVTRAIKDGVDLETESGEIKRRMLVARQKA
jgi:hypothetical protein